jgi:transcriptional regulator with XRE-family HTH domain
MNFGTRDPELSATFGRNVRTARLSAGLSQVDLARALEVDNMRVSNWERGIHRPNDRNLRALVSILGHDAAWYFTDHKEPVS